jgi:streptogramin lyase
MEDANGILWTSPYPNAALVGIDTETVQIVKNIPIPAYVHGVSIDFEGNVWGVEFGGSNAYRVNPDTLVIDTVTGLVGAYTYSDMTGFAISAAGTPSG